MLNVKADALKEDPKPIPERPTYGELAEPEWFTPFSRLAALYDNREPYIRYVDDAIEREEKKIYIRCLEDAQRGVTPLDKSERWEHNKRVKEYQEARRAYWPRVRLWEAGVEKEMKRRKAETDGEKTVKRMRREIKRVLSSNPRVTLIGNPCSLAKRRPERCTQHNKIMQREGRIDRDRFDQNRLDKMTVLPYEAWLVPRSGLECYSRFKFASGEERWLTRFEQELLESEEAKKIPARGRTGRRKANRSLGPPDSRLI